MHMLPSDSNHSQERPNYLLNLLLLPPLEASPLFASQNYNCKILYNQNDLHTWNNQNLTNRSDYSQAFYEFRKLTLGS